MLIDGINQFVRRLTVDTGVDFFRSSGDESRNSKVISEDVGRFNLSGLHKLCWSVLSHYLYDITVYRIVYKIHTVL